MSIKASDLNDRQRAMAGLPTLAVTAEDVEIAVAKSERELQKQILQYLLQHGIEEVLTPTFGKKTTIQAGWPDLTFCAPVPDSWGEDMCAARQGYDGDCTAYLCRKLRCNDCPVAQGHPSNAIPCAWEIKLPKQKLRNSQPEMHERLKKAGWQVAIITSIEDAKAELVRLGVI